MAIALTAEWVQGVLPVRRKNDHKGRYGRLLMACGCSRYRGAAVLSAAAALRSGTGLVQLASTEKVCAAVVAAQPCCTYWPLGEAADGTASPQGIEDALAQNPTALLAGCGLGATQSTAVLLQRLLEQATCPVVLDADALNLLCGNLWSGPDAETGRGLINCFDGMRPAKIITPHPGEMARLCRRAVDEVLADQAGCAASYAHTHNCVVVLKSHITVVATPEGTQYVNDTAGNPGLAKGGSGDVLAGLIAGLLAQGMAPEQAAAAGVWLHAATADEAVRHTGYAALSPADLPAYLGKVLLRLNTGEAID